MDINFELYKIFYHAAKSESFSAAAEKLFISQSAVSQAVKNLEDKIGNKLFFRKSRKVKLTAEGRLLFRHVEQAYNLIKTGENKILEMQNMDLGEISIGVGDTVCKYFLVPFLQKFTLEYPKVKIHVINRTSFQLLDVLKNGLIDFGIVTLPITDKSIQVQRFRTVEDIFTASPAKYGALRNREISLKELAGFPLLLLQRHSATRRNLDTFLEENGIVITPEIELESIDLLVEFARIGLGIAHVLKESTEAMIKNGDLFEVKIAEKLPQRELGIISMNNIPLSQAANRLIGMLKEQSG
jgi:DNA-binding transcriptional LysR family regulator